MLRILTSLALFHWAALFALLTVLCIFADPARLVSIAGATGGAIAVLTPLETGILALGLSFCSCMFFWSALTALAARDQLQFDDAVASTAFGAAAVILIAFAVLTVLFDVAVLAPVVALSAGALLASYFLVLAFEKSRKQRAAAVERSAASMAAALARLSVRASRQTSGVR